MSPPSASPSITVRAVPRDIELDVRNASVSRVAVGKRRLRWAARQSDGTTSKPTPGSSVTPAAFASASKLARSTSKTPSSPVMSRIVDALPETGVDKRQRGPGEGAGTIEDDRDAAQVGGVEIEDAVREAEFVGQLLWIAGPLRPGENHAS